MPKPASLPIELRLNAVGQLFNSFDPSPFHERDLDEDAEHFIIDWARELPSDAPLSLRIHLPPEQAQLAETTGVAAAFGNYFQAQAEATQRELDELFHVGRRYLLFGLPVLAFCLLAAQYLREGPLAGIITESLVIVGWVANWRPIEVFLYDWQGPRRRMRLYQRLASAKVEIVAAS